MPMTRSASRAMRLAAKVPVAPIAPRLRGRSKSRPVALDMPEALAKESLRIGIGLRLNILGEGQGDSACFCRAGQHAHGLRERGQQLFRTCDAVPVAADRLEAIVNRNILSVFGLKLLQDRRDVAAGKNVSRQ